MKWIVEYSALAEDKVWTLEGSIDVVRGDTFEDFEEAFLKAHEDDPAHGYYRIHPEGIEESSKTYSWGTEGRLLPV